MHKVIVIILCEWNNTKADVEMRISVIVTETFWSFGNLSVTKRTHPPYNAALAQNPLLHKIINKFPELSNTQFENYMKPTLQYAAFAGKFTPLIWQ